MTESTIDMDRAMQGIDCEVITWTKCSDLMPPDDETKIICVRNGAEPIVEKGYIVNLFQIVRLTDAMWTLYTEEAWQLLSHKTD